MDRTRIASWLIVAALLGSLAALVVPQGWSLPVLAPAKPTAVTYFYEKDRGFVPSGVAVAIDKLNRSGVMATIREVDTTNPSGNVPKQYEHSQPAAIEAGIPSLVVMSSDKVLRVVKSPKTEQEVMEAAQ